MKKVSLLHSLVFGNKALVICVAFTLATLIDLFICVSSGIMDISYWHLGMRLLLCTLVVLSLHIFRAFDRLPLLAMLVIHFFLSILIMLAWVWITSLFGEIHPHAYQDAARTVVIIYPVIIVGSLIIDGIRTVKANRILKARFQETTLK